MVVCLFGWLVGSFVRLFIYFHLFLLHHFQENCDPYFLTTVVFPEGAVNDTTRLKLAVFDVRDREKEEVCEECTDHLAFAENQCNKHTIILFLLIDVTVRSSHVHYG